MDFRRTIPIQTQLNQLEYKVLQWLSERQARNESEMLRELIRKAGDEAGFFSQLAVVKANEDAAVSLTEPADVAG